MQKKYPQTIFNIMIYVLQLLLQQRFCELYKEILTKLSVQEVNFFVREIVSAR